MTKKAIILAAGVGRRLGNHAQFKPKCLLEFGGGSLLQRHLTMLIGIGMDEVVVCVGYQAQQIQETIQRLDTVDQIRTINNPHFDRGSIVSLWTVRGELCNNDITLLMDADVLYDQRLLERLLTSGNPNCFLLDRDFEHGEEPVKLAVRDGRLVEFRKQISADLQYDFYGESVGFFRFSRNMAQHLADRTEYYFDTGRHEQPHEEAIRDLLRETPEAFGFEDVTGLPWIEIDFPEDVVHAREDVLPKLIPLLRWPANE